MSPERLKHLQAACPFKAADYDKRDAWLLEAALREKRVADGLRIVRSGMDAEKARHQKAMDALRAAEEKAQKDCDHEWARGTAEDEPYCRLCGYTEPPYRRS